MVGIGVEWRELVRIMWNGGERVGKVEKWGMGGNGGEF